MATIWRREPLVAGAVVVVGELREQSLPALPDDGRWIGVVAADDLDHLHAMLAPPWSTLLAEIIFTTPPDGAGVPGDEAAMHALDHVGIGQDFVFTVPALADAVTYAIGALDDTSAHWDGVAVLVLGSAASVAAVSP